MNPILDLIEARSSTRAFRDEALTDEEKLVVLHAAMRAPTAGNLMLYSIIEIDDQVLKDELAVTCDNQPFIAKAPWVLIFVADYQKWIDLFRVSDVSAVEGVMHRDVPGVGDLMLACCDAAIAAQNAVVAAESLGIGSCYIGDIMENGERHAEMLSLPPHTFPVAMLCLGKPLSTRAPVPRYEKHVVHRNSYHRLSDGELSDVSAELEVMHAPHGLRPGVANLPQDVYRRKFTAEFTREMNRSVEFWLERWQRAE